MGVNPRTFHTQTRTFHIQTRTLHTHMGTFHTQTTLKMRVFFSFSDYFPAGASVAAQGAHSKSEAWRQRLREELISLCETLK